jgi:hypothetical protein
LELAFSFLLRSESLGRGSRKLIGDPELRKRMGEAGREKALREFALDRMLSAAGVAF